MRSPGAFLAAAHRARRLGDKGADGLEHRLRGHHLHLALYAGELAKCTGDCALGSTTGVWSGYDAELLTKLAADSDVEIRASEGRLKLLSPGLAQLAIAKGAAPALWASLQ